MIIIILRLNEYVKSMTNVRKRYREAESGRASVKDCVFIKLLLLMLKE